MPRNYSVLRKAGGGHSSAIVASKPKATMVNVWQKQATVARKPVIATVSSAMRKKKEFAAPISPTEASVAPAYYSGTDGE